MTEAIMVFTTAESEEDARRIAETLLERRLAACAQVSGPTTSVYRWKGAVETDTEWSCVIKTKRSLFDELENAINEIHPYDTPEILALPVVAGGKAYLDWLMEMGGE